MGVCVHVLREDLGHFSQYNRNKKKLFYVEFITSLTKITIKIEIVDSSMPIKTFSIG